MQYVMEILVEVQDKKDLVALQRDMVRTWRKLGGFGEFLSWRLVDPDGSDSDVDDGTRTEVDRGRTHGPRGNQRVGGRRRPV